MEMPVESKRVPVRRRASAEREAGSREAELQIWHQGSHNSNVEYRFSASVSRRDDSFAFFHRVDAVDGGNRDPFSSNARPVNLDPVHVCCHSETQVQTLVGIRSIASAPNDPPALPTAACGCPSLCA